MKKVVTIFKTVSLFAITLAVLTTAGCKKDEDPPKEENEEEVITDLKLIFTNTSNSSDIVTARAQDPDGTGVKELQILDTLNLDTSKTYALTFEIMNNLETPGEDIGEEVKEEGDEHQIFFSFSNNAFANPMGNGNIDNASDPVNYTDKDSKGNPIGLNSTWETSKTQLSNGSFKVRLQHQPDLKTSTSGANDGDTDFELDFVLNIK